jgi:hypothetical protein
MSENSHEMPVSTQAPSVFERAVGAIGGLCTAAGNADRRRQVLVTLYLMITDRAYGQRPEDVLLIIDTLISEKLPHTVREEDQIVRVTFSSGVSSALLEALSYFIRWSDLQLPYEQDSHKGHPQG